MHGTSDGDYGIVDGVEAHVTNACHGPIIIFSDGRQSESIWSLNSRGRLQRSGVGGGGRLSGLKGFSFCRLNARIDMTVSSPIDNVDVCDSTVSTSICSVGSAVAGRRC